MESIAFAIDLNATITQQHNVTEKVAKGVYEEWNMKQFKAKQQTGTKTITKDNPDFNRPEGKKVVKERDTLLDIIYKYPAKRSSTIREATASLWLSLDKLFIIWQTVEPEKSKWQALLHEPRK